MGTYKTLRVVTFAVLSLFGAFSHTYAVELGKPLITASEVYLKSGVGSFIPTLVKGSLLEGEKNLEAQTNQLRTIERYYGNFLGVKPIKELKLNGNIRIVYCSLNYEKAPVFLYIILYANPKTKNEVVTSFKFNTELWQIFPIEFVEQ